MYQHSGYVNTGNQTITTAGTSAWYPTETYQFSNGNAIDYSQLQRLMDAQYKENSVTLNGNKPIVVCNNESVECKDLDEAQATAEKLAHKHQCDAYILKPIKKVAPKRDVVTTDLE